MQIIPCPRSQVYGIQNHSCMPMERVTRSNRVRLSNELEQNASYRQSSSDQFGTTYNPQNMVYCPLGSNGVYPHPFDCTKYLKCVHGRLVSESCANGNAFSVSRKVCDLKEVVNSNDRVPTPRTSFQSSHVSRNWNKNGLEVIRNMGKSFFYCNLFFNNTYNIFL